jgi:hypothetical protein
MAETLRGTDRNDTLVGTAEADRISAFGGDDAIYGGAGNDRLNGGAGKDHIWAGGGNDIVIGGPAGDLALSTPFPRHERIFGGAGNDVVLMRVPGSIVFAGPGHDRIDARDPQTDCAVPQNRPLADVGRHAAFRPLDIPHCSNVVNTGPGDNFVRAHDGNLDVISCLGRRDRVIIDQYDRVGPECDIVRRVNR